MTVRIRNYQTGEILQEHPMVRFMTNEGMMCCTLAGGFLPDTPEKGRLYAVEVSEADAGVSVQKLAMFTSYNFLMDKDGEDPATISDNSLIFQVVG